MKSKPEILVVEDNDVDVRYLRGILSKAGISTITHARDGQQAMRHLRALASRQQEKTESGSIVMLLDLDLPIHSGFDILKYVQHQPALRHLKVFVVTSSDDENSRSRVAESGAHGYIVKPLSLAQLANMLESLELTLAR
jgi:CheY-like chemotaxis protein